MSSFHLLLLFFIFFLFNLFLLLHCFLLDIFRALFQALTHFDPFFLKTEVIGQAIKVAARRAAEEVASGREDGDREVCEGVSACAGESNLFFL